MRNIRAGALARHVILFLLAAVFALLCGAAMSLAAETAVIRPGFFAAESQRDFIQARDCAARGSPRDMEAIKAMYDRDRIFALPENVTVEIAAFDSRTLTCRIGTPRSGKYYWTDIEAVKPGYRRQQQQQQLQRQKTASRAAAPRQSETADRVKTEEEKNQEAAVKMYTWFMSQPLINAERVRAREKYGIDNDDVVFTDYIGGTVGQARDEGKGRGVELEGTANATVVVGVSERVLGKVDYSQVPVDFDKDRSWTAALYTSGGQLFQKQTTAGDIVSFQIPAGRNDQSLWRVKFENVRGLLDQQIMFVIVVKKHITLNK